MPAFKIIDNTCLIENEQERGEMMLKSNLQSDPKSNLQSYPKSNLQAYNSDYEGSRYDKGHLYPHCHAPDEETSKSTFTLTNTAPQRCDFNRFWYSKVEAKVNKALTTCVAAKKTPYVVTGVVPDTGSNPLTLKKDSQVNVPTHFWTAYCCCDNNDKECQFGAFILEREADEPDEFKTSTAPPRRQGAAARSDPRRK
ncbi:endonuclease domain-containing 1 protein-like [Astyanax mexicanus]|uniref:endonuclease domain-containing 1 protein-like n=1 Tax=Astyanax mexicanus TaxID=7994 RepID=UPI0020CAC961|nr:endonuclease domain-containing 1 protein-like [Astyanax mexicanus]